MKIEPWVAVWGAFTGTLATAYNLWQLILDRARLKVEAQIAIVHTTRIQVILTVSAVNIGRRPVMVKSVAALLPEQHAPLLVRLLEENRVKVSEAKPKSSDLHILSLFGSRQEQPKVLKPDGGQEVWTCPLQEGLKFLSENQGDDEFGTAYVELTSGKKVFCNFRLLSEKEWPPL